MFILTQTILIILLFCLSAFFSGSETAIFSLSPLTRKKLIKERGFNVLREPNILLPTIFFGNTLVNICISYFITATVIRLSGTLALSDLTKITIYITFFILVFGEITPKLAASRMAEPVVKRGIHLLLFFKKLFTPFSLPLSIPMRKLWGREEIKPTSHDVRTMISLAAEEGYVSKKERVFVEKVLSLKEIRAEDVMTPRKNIKAYDEKIPISTIISKGYVHSRIPIYRKRIDNITGILYIKDLIPCLRKNYLDDKKAKDLKRETFFVPSSMRLSELLEDFQERRVHIAVCVDEYGGVDGLVTLDDILKKVTS